MRGRENRSISLKGGRAIVALVIITFLACAELTLLAQSDQQQLIVTASFDGKTISPREPLQLTLSRELMASEGRIAVMIGKTDVSSPLVASGNTLIYSPNIIPLSEGQTQVTVYLVTSHDAWKQIAAFTLNVQMLQSRQSVSGQSSSFEPQTSATGEQQGSSSHQTRRLKWGLDRAEMIPSITIGMKSQAFETHFPDQNRPPRPTFADATLQASLRADIARAAFNSQIQFDVLGSSFRQEALRFAERGNDAPRIDLSSYLMQFQAGKTRFSVGHVGFGTNRHLINSFSSRGLSLTLPLSRRADFSLAAMNGTSIVGWNNFFGLNRANHQIISGSFGFEFVPERPGGLRIESTLLDGRLLPLSNFNQGNINDAERSRGAGIRILASDKEQRFRFDGGLARSLFTNPSDPFLGQGRDVVAVSQVARNARYIDASYTMLQNFALSETRNASLTINYRHERVDPLFRSIAAFTQADRNQNQFEIVTAIGEVTAVLSHQRFSDNLANIPSILKSLSRRTNFILGAPVGSFFSSAYQSSVWFPRISYSYDDVHQFGASAPINGGFENPGTIPDQVSRNQNLNADWLIGKARFGYRFNRSFQDNRQQGRERADLKNLANNFSAGWNPTSTFDLSFDLNFESAFNREATRIDRTLRVGTIINWRMTPHATLAAIFSATAAGDTQATSRNRSAEIDLQWAYRFASEKSRYRRWQTNFFIRYANRYSSSRDFVFNFDNLTKTQTINLGLNFTFF